MRDSHEILVSEESDKLLDNDEVVQEALRAVEQNGMCSSTRSTRSARAKGAWAATCRARAFSAICCH